MKKTKMKRIAIYLFYDKDGIIDSYIPYMLKDVRNNVDYIYFVSNGKIQEESKKKIKNIVDEICERKNEGFDVWGYKEAIQNIGFEKLREYDELIMMNYTIMGPVYPFREMFDEMDKRTELDFWGITQHHRVDIDPFGTIECGYIPDHIQSHFIVVRKKMLKSKEFKDYWDNMPMINNYNESIGFHETRFTYYLGNLGYKWDVYVNTDDIKYLDPHPILFYPGLLIEEKKCPIFKRRSFFHEYDETLYTTMGEPGYELLKVIENYTNYDKNMIWENLLRCYDMSCIKDNAHLNYILPEKIIVNNKVKKEKIALVFHAYFEDLIDETKKYVESMPDYADVYITTNTKEKKKFFEEKFKKNKFNKLEVRIVENRGRDVSALLVCVKDIIMDYDIVCFAHDKKVVQIKHGSVGKSFGYNCLENLLPSHEFVLNVLDVFEKNPKCGLLTPMPPYHSDYYLTIGNEWAENYEITKSLAHTLGLNVQINEKHPPIAPLGTMFWFRTKGMKKLFDYDWEYKDFPKEPNKYDGTLLHAIERIYGFVEQDAGYYCGWLFSDKCASMTITNFNYMLSGFNKLFMKHGMVDRYLGVRDRFANRMDFMDDLADAGKVFERAFPEFSVNSLSKSFKLYLDTGKGFNEEETVTGKYNVRDNSFECTFDLKKIVNNIIAFRIDPGEKGLISLSDLDIKVFSNNEQEDISKYKMTTNALVIDGVFVFLYDDPMIVYSLDKPNRIDKITICGVESKDTLSHIQKKLYSKSQNKKSIIERAFNKIKRTLNGKK